VLGEKGKQIIKFMEDMRLGLTITQAAHLFYSDRFGYDYARIKLKRMWEKGYIKKYTNDYSDELIYYLDKKPSFHDNAVLNVYSNFINRGYKINEFRHEIQLMEGKYRADAIINADNDNEIRTVLIEVDRYSPTNIKKYDEVYESGELQRQYGVFPMILILTDVERKYKSDYFEIVSMDIKCSDFNKVLI
jgi:hypothetical protein